MKQSTIQNFSWGQIKWLMEAKNIGQQLSVGIVSIFPGKQQNPHRHSVDEQIVYVLNGEGIYILKATTRIHI